MENDIKKRNSLAEVRFFVVPSDAAYATRFYSPVRLTPAVGVKPGAHYQSSIQELLHPESTVAKCSPYCSTLTICAKKTVALCHRYPSAHSQASLNE